MAESRVLSNIPYTIKNRSNYDIVVEETRDIVDVPYFPAQNLVDVSGNLDFYKPDSEYYIPFIDQYHNSRIFGLLNREDARFLFLEFADNARYLHYSFGGSSFPQGRDYYSISYNGRYFYVYGGYANGRCMDDLWKYDLHTNQWNHLNYCEIILNESEAPTRRRKPSILIQGEIVWIFGGETDILTINQAYASNMIPLNDLWSFNTASNTWKKYDLQQYLPHRTGHVIYADYEIVKILIEGGINEIGIKEYTAIYTVDIASDEISIIPFTPPFEIDPSNILLTIDGIVHVLSKKILYKWNNNENQFTTILSNIDAINPIDKNYWVMERTFPSFGENPAMGRREILNAVQHAQDGTILSTKTIGLLPVGIQIPQVNLDNLYTLFYGGLVTSSVFNESTYFLNHATLAITKYDFPPGERPNERVLQSMSYDKYRGRVYLFGGFDGSKFYNDLWYFDIGPKVWVKVHDQMENTDSENLIYPQPRQKAGIAITNDNYIYILGGYSDVHSFNDFWRYDIENDTWTKMYLIENIPWGSSYKIFEWRDRLFLFNGAQLYRYYDENKQFAVQPFLISTDTRNPAGTDEKETTLSDKPKDLAGIIKTKQFLDTPIRVTVVNDFMFVQNPQVNFRVDLESRVVNDLVEQFGMDSTTLVTWLDRYFGINDDGASAYYINLSSLQPLTKNQIPHSFFHKRINEPFPDGVFYKDITTMEDSRLAYRDNSGLFRIQGDIDPIDKAQLLVNSAVGYAALQSEDPTFDFDNINDWWDKTISVLAEPTTYPYGPMFLYAKYALIDDMYQGAQRIIYNLRKKRIYAIYDNGNMLRINPVDNTFFVYFSRIWKGAAIGYHEQKNKVYAFGGFRNPIDPPDPEGSGILGSLGSISSSGNSQKALDNTSSDVEQPIYVQGAKLFPRRIYESFVSDTKAYEITHPGLMIFDLDLNEMNVGTVTSFVEKKKFQAVDLSVTKVHLTDVVRKYLNFYDNDPAPTNLEYIKKKIYTTTQPLLDDLSIKDFHFDGGERPTGRAFMSNVQVGNKLYIFGGCQCVQNTCNNSQETAPYWCTRPEKFNLWPNRFVRHSFWDFKGKPGGDAWTEEQVAERNIPIDNASLKASYFDMDDEKWVQIADLPEWRYMASAIASTDNRYIYIVGGYTDEFLPTWEPEDPKEKPKIDIRPSRDIIVYSVNNNTYEKIKGIPSTYAGRAMPLLYWIDDTKLLIMYGFGTIDKFRKTKYCQFYTHFHIPINDAWVYDTQHHVFYKVFSDLCGIMGIFAKDQFYVDKTIQTESKIYVLTPTPEFNPQGDPVMKLYEWNLVSGDITPMEIIPTEEIQKDFTPFAGLDPKKNPREDETPPAFGSTGATYDGTKSSSTDVVPGIPGIDKAAFPVPPTETEVSNMKVSDMGLDSELEDSDPSDINYQNLFLSIYKNTNFRFRYSWLQEHGEYQHKTLFVIGERCEDSGLQEIQRMILGYKEADFRIWYVDIEAPDGWRILKQIIYSYPLPVSPTVLAYDGTQYLYCIYNKYNIWRMDFTAVLNDLEGSHWVHLPGCLDGNFLSDTRTDPGWDAFFTPPNYLTLLSIDGRMARMNTETFEWTLDKALPPADPVTKKKPASISTGNMSKTQRPSLSAATGVDNDEIYMYRLGGIAGKVMNIYEKQWDNFFFDMTPTSNVVKFFSSILGPKTWPSFIRRKRLYIINHLGHLFYSWLRIDGVYDVEFQLQNFYKGNEIRIYCDHTFLQNWTNVNVQVCTIDRGWITISQEHMSPIENEVEWGWDSNYTRRYVRIIIDAFGNPKYQYSHCPPNYLSVDLDEAINGVPISHIRVSYKNTPQSYNYMSRINLVELITDQGTLAEYDTPESTSPLEIQIIDPIQLGDAYSNSTSVIVKNTGMQSIKNLLAYVFNNDWMQFSFTPSTELSWVRPNPKNPFHIIDELSSGGSITFYIRAINITDRPQIKDLVITGVYPYES